MLAACLPLPPKTMQNNCWFLTWSGLVWSGQVRLGVFLSQNFWQNFRNPSISAHCLLMILAKNNIYCFSADFLCWKTRENTDKNSCWHDEISVATEKFSITANGFYSELLRRSAENGKPYRSNCEMYLNEKSIHKIHSCYTFSFSALELFMFRVVFGVREGKRFGSVWVCLQSFGSYALITIRLSRF